MIVDWLNSYRECYTSCATCLAELQELCRPPHPTLPSYTSPPSLCLTLIRRRSSCPMAALHILLYPLPLEEPQASQTSPHPREQLRKLSLLCCLKVASASPGGVLFV